MPLPKLTPSDAGDRARTKINAAITEADKIEGKQDRFDLVGLLNRVAAAATKTALEQLATEIRGETADLDADVREAMAAVVADSAARLDAVMADVTAWRFELLPSPHRPGETPVRFALISNAGDLVASPLPLISPTALAKSENGAVVRLRGSAFITARRPVALEINRLYRARFVVQRRANPSDPSNDAVACGLVYVDQSGRILGDVVALKTFPALITANGRQEVEALISRTAVLGAAFTPPPAARAAFPVVASYGLDGITDVEVLALEDVTSAFVLAPPVAAFEARLAKLEADNIAARLQALESEAGTPSKVTFASKGDAAAASIPESVQVVELLGRGTVGDGGSGLYARPAGAPPPGADTFTSGGAVFQRVVAAADVAAALLNAGFAAWMASLTTAAPTAPGQPYNNGGIPAVSQ